MRAQKEAGSPAQQKVRVGLVGGMSWHSTALYYERLNRALEQRLGPHHSFEGLVWNLNYASLLSAATDGDWASVEKDIVDAASGLTASGCGIVVLTAVTAHRFRDAVLRASAARVPHVLSGVARALEGKDLRKIGVLGTNVTCSSDFVGHYLGSAGREIIMLDRDRQQRVDDLIQGLLTVAGGGDAGRQALREAVGVLRRDGAQAVVLACTELPLLLPLDGIDVDLIDSVACHVDDICSLMLEENHAR